MNLHTVIHFHKCTKREWYLTLFNRYEVKTTTKTNLAGKIFDVKVNTIFRNSGCYAFKSGN